MPCGGGGLPRSVFERNIERCSETPSGRDLRHHTGKENYALNPGAGGELCLSKSKLISRTVNAGQFLQRKCRISEVNSGNIMIIT